ncbi:MAG: hypothetical protein IPQ09_07905 [Myxococcales bacterium]|nr:hypothetical protein [Myxococcales bacterium]
MKRAMAILALLSAGASALAWASACREPTQLTLELTTDVKCSDHLTTAVVVGTLAQTAQSLAERPPAIQTSACTERGAGDAYIGSLVVVPSGDDTAEVAVKVVAGIGISPDQCTDPKDKRCIVARRVRKYVANTKLVLPITLNDACRGVPCGVDETCSRGQCVSVRCEDTNTCDPPPRDGGADAGDGGEPPDADAAVRDGRAPDGAVQVPFTMALGDGFACALRSGVAYCWGKNEKGQTGQTPSQSAVTTPTRVTGVPPLPPFTTLHAAGDRVLALTGPGEVWGWGRNAGNNLGPGGDGVVAPQRLWTGVAAVSAGRFATCLLKNETVQCFGDRLTIGPTGVDGGTISELCTGATFALALSGGRVFGVRNDMGRRPQAMRAWVSSASRASGSTRVMCTAATCTPSRRRRTVTCSAGGRTRTTLSRRTETPAASYLSPRLRRSRAIRPSPLASITRAVFPRVSPRFGTRCAAGAAARPAP